jgi:ornithine carbamoyltransferase
MTRAIAGRPRANSIPARPDIADFPHHFLSVLDLSASQLDACLDLAVRLKRERPLGSAAPTARAIAGRNVAILFDKPSLRTRTTFDIAVAELGGHPVFVPSEVALGGRETVADVARNLERWVDAVVIRTFAQQVLHEVIAAAPRLRVVNALTDEEHPCQALADFMTLRERVGELRGRTLAYVGDGNNVAISLAHTGALLGVNVRIASPPGYAIPEGLLGEARAVARHGARIEQLVDPAEAVRGADAVYTDVWASMGEEREAAKRRKIFADYQVDAALMGQSRPGAIFMHCLPAHRGEEVSAEVMDGPASAVFDQAENRLHSQKALLLLLLS